MTRGNEPDRPHSLPVEAVREDLESCLQSGPVVLTAPTASGKSTQVPRWCAAKDRVLVVEPRRVACRSLAVRVAQLEGATLGNEVGYSVRDDHRAGQKTRILFATPGVVLRMLSDPTGTRDRCLPDFGILILDEFHERRLDVDLILALALDRFRGRLLVMSATMDGDRVAGHLGGRHLHAPGRVFPVDHRHVPGRAMLPEVHGLENRVLEALGTLDDHPGTVLVFLPGKGEIASLSQRLAGRGRGEVVELHGGLTLEEQGRAFEPPRGRRVILATNVAETSVTLPGITAVIDSGLVRQTRYHNDRGFLTLAPVAMDSAEQRAGRAGRLGPGLCCRLWDQRARLEAVTNPEMHRESLVPLVLAAGACGADPRTLPFLDPPRDHALETALADLEAIGAIGPASAITDRGKRLFGLPLDAPLGRLLVEAESTNCLPDALDLVSALAVGRRLFLSDRRPTDEKDDLRSSGNDALALIRTVREGRPERHGLSAYALCEARAIRRRLGSAWGLTDSSDKGLKVDARRLAMTAMAADPRCVHVARRRRGRVAWSNGGTEVELARESAIADTAEAIAVLDTHCMGLGTRDTRILVTCAMPLPLPWLVEAGVGRERLSGVTYAKGAVLARIERVHARKVVAVREEVPLGRLARESLRDLFLRGSILKEALGPTTDRLEAAALLHRLRTSGRLSSDEPAEWESPFPWNEPVPSPQDWVLSRLEDLGVESGEDLSLLTPGDLLAPDLPGPLREKLDREFPREVSVGDAVYRVEYDLTRNRVVLHPVRGQRNTPPPLTYLPAFRGFAIGLKDKNRIVTLRKA